MYRKINYSILIDQPIDKLIDNMIARFFVTLYFKGRSQKML